MKFLRVSGLAIWLWMMGATLTLLATAFITTGDAPGRDMLALGALFMFAGLVAPVVESMFDTVAKLRQARAESNGGDSA